MLREDRRNPLLVAEQQETHAGVALCGEIGAGNHQFRPEIAAHGVERDNQGFAHGLR